MYSTLTPNARRQAIERRNQEKKTYNRPLHPSRDPQASPEVRFAVRQAKAR